MIFVDSQRFQFCRCVWGIPVNRQLLEHDLLYGTQGNLHMSLQFLLFRLRGEMLQTIAAKLLKFWAFHKAPNLFRSEQF